ncbi:MAG TPA: lysophospholipid acyltransferase family protein [Candidatus Hydrogenedentes bacterium]|jgi:1-acyl-sn-glycerol-3-phosphate acyltransferase|nr:MAG: 2-acyl-glycerophospho-ethanolamine acyltransferase [Candidatus Hydrogenedentes bacterium ADurb.Bin170]HNZ48583.1 lysophospholipid acyltransferase family protein [Candidatus Hydrogenedentota bacterium]HOD96090.1 lysophospholipid acyltransferase family protein [Candidatus Hydrogenedentota bacterium]HOH41625.1 lysophospholipid acyltransferase family protein [Candidatus Hydrogenedentota bacterium]HOM47111.1 lysophospholipid acyltransferase family protein [Candidatus Hydrogenedentota bacteri
MKSFKTLVKVILLLLISLCFFALRFAFWGVLFRFPVVDRKTKRWILRYWARTFSFVIGMKRQTSGAVPAPPFLLVANHITYFDMLVLACETGCIFVSREDVEHWPVIGTFAKSLHMLFIDRSKRRDALRVNRLISKALTEGDGIVIFPESRVSCGMAVEEFKSPLLQPAVDLQIPVHYASISYRTPPSSPVEGAIVSWWRPESFVAHLIRFLHYQGATALIHFGESPIPGTDRKVLAQELHAAVQAQFIPLRQAASTYNSSEFPVQP